jgi:hypothetical protein
LGKKPKDWDVTTNATPEKIQGLFENTFYTNDFGTVGIVQEGVGDESLKVIEVTPYRSEGKYSDARRPDAVTWATNVHDDLKRRDFTINALAFDTFARAMASSLRWIASGSKEALPLCERGIRSMPQIGHLPGLSILICGCIAHVHIVPSSSWLSASLTAVVFSPALPPDL